MKNESQTLGFIIVSASLALASIYFLTVSNPKTAMVLMAFSILSFVVAMLEPKRGPRVEFDADGVYDPRLGIGKIYWKEVSEFYIADGAGNRFLCLEVNRPERFVTHVDRSVKMRMQLNHTLGFKRINVDVRHINMTVQDLHRRIEHRIQSAQRDRAM
jgi:hypothetical protein